MSKKLVTVDGCQYCPYYEKIKIDGYTHFCRCNKLQICVEDGKTYLPRPMEHLFKFCPLPDYSEETTVSSKKKTTISDGIVIT